MATPIPDEFYLAVGKTVVHAASLEHLLLELASAVLVERDEAGLNERAARRKWHRKPSTVLIDMMLESPDRVQAEDRVQFATDMKGARAALNRRHITAHTSWPFGETDMVMIVFTRSAVSM